MQLTQINVQGLYGLHNYDIHFSEDECLKIIHAPNGYGKTTVLKLVNAILKGDLIEIRKVPFKSFAIIINEGDLKIVVEKEEETLYYRIKEITQKLEYCMTSSQNLPEGLEEKLQKIQQEMPIYFIDANRLWIERAKEQTEEKVVTPTVLVYAKELREWMQEALAESNYCGQELDRSFPYRLMKCLEDTEISCLTEEEIQKGLNRLEDKRRMLEGAGLYSHLKSESIQNIGPLDDKMKMVLSLYIEDSNKKLKALEGLAARINLLCNLINKRFSYKVMEVNMREGFVFKVPTNEVLKADKLSSGEQNELILMFQLLFKCPAQAIILMDEPEISLHIAWQQSFLEDMEIIAELSKIRMMIATHSPDIINGRWDLTSGLEEEVCDPI